MIECEERHHRRTERMYRMSRSRNLLQPCGIFYRTTTPLRGMISDNVHGGPCYTQRDSTNTFKDSFLSRDITFSHAAMRNPREITEFSFLPAKLSATFEYIHTCIHNNIHNMSTCLSTLREKMFVLEKKVNYNLIVFTFQCK